MNSWGGRRVLLNGSEVECGNKGFVDWMEGRDVSKRREEGNSCMEV
jgi:hypothetical protein